MGAPGPLISTPGDQPSLASAASAEGGFSDPQRLPVLLLTQPRPWVTPGGIVHAASGERELLSILPAHLTLQCNSYSRTKELISWPRPFLEEAPPTKGVVYLAPPQARPPACACARAPSASRTRLRARTPRTLARVHARPLPPGPRARAALPCCHRFESRARRFGCTRGFPDRGISRGARGFHPAALPLHREWSSSNACTYRRRKRRRRRMQGEGPAWLAPGPQRAPDASQTSNRPAGAP